MKLALGTASFGTSYGIGNLNGKVNIIEAKKILKFAKSKNISVIDTAVAYGDSEQYLGKIGVDSYKVVSKLPSVPVEALDVKKWVITETKNSIKRLGIKSLYALLLHNPDQLLGPNGKEIYNSLIELKSKNIVKKIGVSIYNPDELGPLFSVGDFDIIQCPMNIIDRRLVDSGWLKKLKNKNMEVHTRSCFLQGLLLMKRDDMPDKFKTWDPIWLEWNKWLEKNKFSAFQACLSYCLSFDDLDCVVVGVENAIQLQQIVSVYESTSIYKFPNISSKDTNLLNPANWKNL